MSEREGFGERAPANGAGDARGYRTWWVFYIDPTEPQGSGWKTAGTIGGPFSADEAIAHTVGRVFDTPFWAFALDKGGQHGAYYELHYPEGYDKPRFEPRRLGPGGYVAEWTANGVSAPRSGANRKDRDVR